eukprot:TRINITY_DN2992_c0_g2_i2.p1 TRINITY_DN2992_c0_g2~~TRINITY_DN2992_c0_g2_i2.p1  ORF type:complete len:483 (-),score=105.43 TRINITY_DN2992_c0_g2_i2:148-1596(-)
MCIRDRYTPGRTTSPGRGVSPGRADVGKTMTTVYSNLLSLGPQINQSVLSGRSLNSSLNTSMQASRTHRRYKPAYSHVVQHLEGQLRFKPLSEVDAIRRRLSVGVSPNFERGDTFGNVKKGLEQQLQFKPFAEVEEQRRRLSRTSFPGVPQRSLTQPIRQPNQTQTVSLHQAKRQLETELRFRPLPEVQELRRRVSKSDIVPAAPLHTNPKPPKHVAAQLQGQLHFKSYHEVEEQRRRLSRSYFPITSSKQTQQKQQQGNLPPKVGNVARQLEENLRFRPLSEVQSVRRRLSNTPLPDDVYFNWTLKRDPITDQYVYESQPISLSGSSSVRRRPSKYDPVRYDLEKSLRFRSQGEVRELQQRLVRSEIPGVKTVKHKGPTPHVNPKKRELESQLRFKPYGEVQEMRRRLSRTEFTSPRKPGGSNDVRSKLEAELQFRPYAEVQELRRRASRSNFGSYDSPYGYRFEVRQTTYQSNGYTKRPY